MTSPLTNTARLWGTVSAVIVLSACTTVEGSGHVVSEERIVGDFNRVSLHGRGTIYFTQAPEQQVLIEGEDNIIERIVSRVADGKLILRQRKNVILDPTRPIRYHLSAPALTRVELDDSCGFATDSLEVPRFSMNLDDSSEGHVAGLVADELVVEIDGSARLTIAGLVGQQTVEVDASGRYEALELRSARADVDVDGSGKAKIHATDELSVDVDGSGHVDYRGNPSVRSDIDGSGKLHAID